MKTRAINLYQVNIPFNTSIDHNLKKRSYSDSIVLEVQTLDGHVGYGEGAARSYVTGENIATIAQAAHTILEPLAALDINNLNEIERIVRRVQNEYQLPALAAAIEMALLDIWGQENACSLSNSFKNNNNFTPTYSAVLPFLPLEKMSKWIQLIKSLDFQQIKLKVGHERDEQYLALLRKELGDKVVIRLDANRAWSLAQALERVKTFEQYNIESIEEPLSVAALHQLPKLSEAVNTPIMLDESVCSIEQVVFYCNAIAAPKLRFNLKLSKMGGALATARIHALAQANGIKCQLGCNVGETAILSAVGRLFAQQHELIALEGSYATFFMEDDIAKQTLTFGARGIAEPIAGHGIGITIDKEKLVKYSQKIYASVTDSATVSV